MRRLLLTPALLALTGCSIRGLAVSGLADALAQSAEVYARDDDPEFVRDALPFALKTVEGLLLEEPENETLLLAAASGFTQYANAFLEGDARAMEDVDYTRALELRERAFRMYLRARDYGLRLLELEPAGLGERLRTEPYTAARELGADDASAAFWTGAAWGGAVSTGLERPEVIADLDAVRALLGRVLELDEDFDGGAAHEAMITIEALPATMGGSVDEARAHFRRAVELTQGRSAGPFVSLALNVALPAQEREEFEELLRRALAVDRDAVPELRLANTLAQRRARVLLAQADELFL
jgi:tetratricopeptide (TPR) repeat protein